jgi:hypothetical protein
MPVVIAKEYERLCALLDEYGQWHSLFSERDIARLRQMLVATLHRYQRSGGIDDYRAFLEVAREIDKRVRATNLNLEIE